MTTLLDSATTTATNDTATITAYRIVLTGFMGAGKSTVGRLLAAQLGWIFIDIDAEVELKYGMSIADMFAVEGEEVFRRRESAAIARALGKKEVVIALGGGAPEILTNRLLLEQTTNTAAIFLDAPFEVLFDRCVLQEGAAVRPVLMDAAGAAARFHLRAPFYRRCAKHHIETAEQVPHQTAAAILEALRG
jgi:shikimate kinase